MMQGYPKTDNEPNVFKLDQSGGTLLAGKITLGNGEERDLQDLEHKTITVLQTIDFNAPQMASAIATASESIDKRAHEENISTTIDNEDYFNLVMDEANSAIAEQWPRQDDQKREAQIVDLFEQNQEGEHASDNEEEYTIGAKETEQLGAVVCVYKAACLYKILSLHKFNDIYINEMPPKDGEKDGHTNVIATPPGGTPEQFDAGAAREVIYQPATA